ncbi:Pectinesterase inhibitor 7, partial [Cucurbita argyrosperma subsp. sororia]
MAKSASLLLLLSILTIAATTSAARNGGASNFIKSKCSAATYPDLCVQSLSTFASTIQQNPRQLVQTALVVSLSRAQSTRSFVWKMTKFSGLKKREYAALRDCMEEVGDTVDRLSKSVEELKRVSGSKQKGLPMAHEQRGDLGERCHDRRKHLLRRICRLRAEWKNQIFDQSSHRGCFSSHKQCVVSD